MKKTLLSSMIIILMGLLGACSSNTSDKTSLSEQSVSENKTATPVAISAKSYRRTNRRAGNRTIRYR